MDDVVPPTVDASSVENVCEGNLVRRGDDDDDDEINLSGPEATSNSSFPNDVDHPSIQPPYDGQTFDGLQELVHYLNSYAKPVGFRWRIRTSRKDEKSGVICSVRMVCHKAAKSRGKRPNSLKVGCDVFLTSSLQKDGRWKINKINLQHCHVIAPSPTRTLLLQQQSQLELNDNSGIVEENNGDCDSSFPDGTDSPSMEPYSGQAFRSLQALVQHLHSYAKAVGFHWRTRSSGKDKSGEICFVRLVCSKEGAEKRRKKSNSRRVGCDVTVTSSLQKTGWWTINKINLKHCHKIASNDSLGTEEEEEEEEKEKEEDGYSSLPEGITNPLTERPYKGQTFGSLHALIQHLNSYAKAVGFQWRTRSSRKDEKSGQVCSVRMVCSKEGACKRKGQGIKSRPSIRVGCDVALTSSLQKNGRWKIKQIHLQHCHEMLPNATPLLQQNGSGIEGEEEEEEEEEEPLEPSGSEIASASINDAIRKEQPSIETLSNHQRTIHERDTNYQQSHDPAVNIEQQWEKLKRYMDILIDSNLDNVNELSNMEGTVDVLICHYLGDHIKTAILQVVKELLKGLKDNVSCLTSSKDFTEAELEDLHRENPGFSLMIDREKLALQVEESKLSQLECEEAIIEAEMQKLMKKKESLLSQKAAVMKNVENGKRKMEELKNTYDRIKKPMNCHFKRQVGISNFNATAIATLVDAKKVLFH